jgi:hypothetical protein
MPSIDFLATQPSAGPFSHPFGHFPSPYCQVKSPSVSAASTSGTILVLFADNLPTLRLNTSVERMLICGQLSARKVGMLVLKMYSLKPPYRMAEVHF